MGEGTGRGRPSSRCEATSPSQATTSGRQRGRIVRRGLGVTGRWRKERRREKEGEVLIRRRWGRGVGY